MRRNDLSRYSDLLWNRLDVISPLKIHVGSCHSRDAFCRVPAQTHRVQTQHRQPQPIFFSILFRLAVTCGFFPLTLTAMAPAPDGQVETGVPAFVVMSPEALGLSTAPTDLHVLPDARILVVSQRELAFGDGVRWETFRGTDDQPNLLAQIAVDDAGHIYAGVLNGIARIDLTEGGRWRFSPLETLPDGSREQLPGKAALLADRWYWFGGSDAIFSWRPNSPLQFVGRFGTIDHIFALGADAYLSDQSSGNLHRLKPDGTSEQANAGADVVSESVTCSLPFGDDTLLVGTVSAGLKIFDGESFKPFGPTNAVPINRRITDLCATGDDYLAVAIDNVGIVFLDRAGRTVQVLDRVLDHRLARVRRLVYSNTGVLWALLNEGVARIEFPSPISRYEPILNSGLSYARPLRHDGKLWILADGRAVRAEYDATDRLEGFTDDTPPGRYLFTLDEFDGELFGGSDTGIYLYGTTGWTEILPGIKNARLGAARGSAGKIYFAARGEFGVIEKNAGRYTAQRFPLPDLGDSYGAAVDANGIGWLELGVGLVGRLDPSGPQPSFQLLGVAEGLAPDWVEIYVLDGVARFHLSHLHYRFDDAQRRFVNDRELFVRYPQLANAGGRPVMDKLNRLWFTAEGAPHAIDYSDPSGERVLPLPPIEFFPTSYVVEDDGVVWMSDRRRLARVDLRIPSPPDVPLRALITSAQVLTTGRQLFAPFALAPLDYHENSLVIHFAAPANPFASPVRFEVLLEGSGSQWVSIGSVGSATFHRLKEGDYVFHVRPVNGANEPGEEARLAFSVRPPWHRSTLAWIAYVCTATGLVGFAAWLSSFLQRRENERLEHLVRERTHALNATNERLCHQIVETTEKSAALSVSEERYRALTTELEHRVEARTAELSLSNRELQQRESLFRLVFERAPVGIAWKRADLGNGFHLNSTFRRILGLTHDELMDHALLAELVHPEDAALHGRLARSIEAGDSDSFNLEARFVLADGRTIWGSLSVAVVRGLDTAVIQEIGILEDITPRKHAEEQLSTTYKSLVATSRVAGMAEVATSVLHNVGNVLNSLNVSANVIADANRQQKTATLLKLSALVDEHAADLGAFLTHDPKGQLVPGVLRSLAEHARHEQEWFATEIAAMQQNIDHIKAIIAVQQSYATTAGVMEKLEAHSLFEDALRISAPDFARHRIAIVREFLPVPPLLVEKDKALQILVNLIHNAREACEQSAHGSDTAKTVTLRIEPSTPDVIRFIVRDDGVGIPRENLTLIFSHGFTTRRNGHGFALHSSALAAKAMHGSLTAHSDGPGTGATFILELPFNPSLAGPTPSNVAVFPAFGASSDTPPAPTV